MRQTVAMAALTGILLASSAAQRRNPGGQGYVDSALCVVCHAEIANKYRLSGMGRSFYRAGAANRAQDFSTRNSYYHPASDRYYTLIERDGKLYQRRHQIGYGGKETNVVAKQIDYVVGSGNHARTYLHRTSENKLVELPISWYSENGGAWAMSPGYDRAD